MAVPTPTFRKTVLPSGLKVLTENSSFSHAVSAGLWVNVGTRDEPADKIGLTHLVEHLVFKGTKVRSAYEIALSLEAVGGEINAYTTREYTCYHTISLKEDLRLSLEVLSDLLTAPLFRLEDFHRERAVILQEILMSNDLLEESIFDLFFERVYRGHELSWPIQGTEESVGRIEREDVEKFFSNWYAPENMILTVTGNVDHDEVVGIVDEFFQPRHAAQHQRGLPAFHAVRDWVGRPSEQVHMLIGFPTSSYLDEFRFESYIANAILGGGMTSRLYQSVRENQGLAYTVYSSLNSYHDAGMMMIYAATGPDLVGSVIAEVQREVLRLKREGVTEEELKLYKTQLKGQILLGADDIESRMSSLGVNEMVFEKYRPVEEVIRDIEEVSTKTLRQYLNNHFPCENPAIMLLGGESADAMQAALEQWK